MYELWPSKWLYFSTQYWNWEHHIIYFVMLFPSIHETTKRQKRIWWFQDSKILLLFFVLKGDLQYNNMVKKPASYLCSSHTLQHNNRQVICLYCIIQMLQPHWEMRCCILSNTLSAKHKTIGDITAATSSKDGGMRKTPGSDGYLTALTCVSSTNTLI